MEKAAEFIMQQSAATMDSKQLDTFPLSQLSVDDSSPPQVKYGIDHPLASSTPHTSSTPDNIIESAEQDRQIIPGILNQLYPIITTDNGAHLLTPGDHQSSTDSINTELMKYLEEVEEKCKAKDNYFEGCDKATNTLPKLQQVFHHQGTDDTPLEENAPNKIPESIEEDTGSILENDNT